MFERLEGKDIVLRKARESDLESIWKNVWSDERIAANMLWLVTTDKDAARERLNRTIRYQKDNPAYFVALNDTDEAIGFCGIRKVDDETWSESGVAIAASHQHKGYGHQMLRLLLELAFEKLGADRFIYSCFSTNKASAALCKSLGFSYLSSKEEIREHDGYKYINDSYTLTRDTYYILKERSGKNDIP